MTKSFWCAVLFALLAGVGQSQTVKAVVSFPDTLPSTGGTTTFVQGHDGRLYGITNGAATRVASTNGAVVALSTSGGLTSLHSFAGTDGQLPTGATFSIDGSLYGTTYFGGSAGGGVLFKVTPAGTFTLLHSFTGGPDGSLPAAPPIIASDGNLYGATGNGTVDAGTLYRTVPLPERLPLSLASMWMVLKESRLPRSCSRARMATCTVWPY